MNKQKILCVHLLNDYSGSPLILSEVVKILKNNNFSVQLIFSSGGKGHLDNVSCTVHTYSYVRKNSKLGTLFAFLISQYNLFCKVYKLAKQPNTIIYINTMLPFGAAIAGRLLRKVIIYHLHETSIKPYVLKKFLKLIVSYTADCVIYVSKYLSVTERIDGIKSLVIYNSPSGRCEIESTNFNSSQYYEGKFVVLMACSLRDYKGVGEFQTLSEILYSNTKIHLNLVLNATSEEVERRFGNISLRDNITISPATDNIEAWYKKTSLVLNLSRPEEWVETFGMTLLEAMMFGVPVIGPVVGGPLEIIENGVNGYNVSCNNLEEVAKKIVNLSEDQQLWQKLSLNAKESTQKFSRGEFSKRILSVIRECSKLNN